MKCPICGEHTPDAWVSFQTQFGGGTAVDLEAREGDQVEARRVVLDWMRCANNSCKELVIRIHESYRDFSRGSPGAPYQHTTDTWTARPRFAAAGRVDPAVPPALRRDYQEAAAILPLSPRMSAVLSRRILADLLRHEAGHDEYRLTEQIDAFRADTARPSHVRQPLHHLREIADFGAHTQTDDQAQIIDVDREEAEWTLEIISRLFDYFIVSPEKDKRLYESIDKKLEEAGRKPIKPLPDEEES